MAHRMTLVLGFTPLESSRSMSVRGGFGCSDPAGPGPSSVGSGGPDAGGTGLSSVDVGRLASHRLRTYPIVGEVRRSATVPGFAWREVLWRGASIGILSELDAERRVGVCKYPCMYRTPEAFSDRGIAMLLLAHRRSSAHRLVH